MAYNGLINGSPVFSAGKFGNGITNTSDSNYVSLATATWPDIQALTVEAWLQITGNQVAVAVSTEWWMGMDGNGYFTVGMGSVTCHSGILINDGAWHHCALVVTGGVLTIYVDGVQANSSPILYSAPVAPTVIGRYSIIPGFPWTGMIDEVTFWNYAKYNGPYSVPTAPYTGGELYLHALYHLDSNALDSTGSYGQNIIDPSNPAILYSPFNWSITPGYARTINSGAYLRTIFSGTSLTLLTDTSLNASPFSQFWVRIDNQGWVLFALAAYSPQILVASGLQNGRHSVEVVIKSTSFNLQRWYQSQTIVQITGLLLDPGGSLTSPVRRTKNVLIYGDSITEGLNAINTASLTDVNREDALGCYSYALSTALDAEVGVVGFAGQAVNGYGQGGVPTLAQSYFLIFAGVARSFTSPAPDLVIYNIGTNDSGSITAGLINIIQGILQAAPKSKHLLLNPFNGSHTADLQAVAGTFNSPSVTYQSTTGWFDPSNSIDGVHPYNYCHVELIAPRLYPVVVAFLYSVVSSVQYAFR